jgi:UDP-2-acetamido-2,6-beta-L-arabino-hexul-4-ose reductase
LSGAQAVLHLAGINRADNDERLLDNVLIAQHLTDSLDKAESHPAIVYANSIQAGTGTPFGESKQAAAEHLTEWGRRVGAPIADVRLPNLFGEHGRPRYNSVVATFCHTLARGGEPQLLVDRELPLLHVQDALDKMLELVEERASGVFHPEGWPMTVSALLTKLKGFRDLYQTGEIPDTSNRLDRALFNTYRSFCFPERYPIHPPVRSDDRGALVESVKSHGGSSQVFSSTTRAGVTRGDHFHLRKVERFVVLNGSAVITLRRLFYDGVVRFEVSGKRPALIDMPTMWAHAITNTGSEELTTLFWSDEIFNPSHPDTYTERVDAASRT